MLGMANPTDYRLPPEGQINKKTLIAQYSFAPGDKIKFYLNYACGQNPDTSETKQFDAVITAKFNDKFNISYNGTVNSTQRWNGIKNLEGKSWWGSALYLNFDPRSWFGLTLREELFSDKNQLKAFSNVAEGASVLLLLYQLILKQELSCLFLNSGSTNPEKKFCLPIKKGTSPNQQPASFLQRSKLSE